jgi:glycosyltransferase involved in cell wall biosynthesis/SAM-dependent methyltransferase
MDICTIIAKNYLAQARVLARTFAEHHPDGRCFVLVIDDYEGYIDPASEAFTMLTPEEVGCAEFQEMALRYNVLELSTAVKPWLLAYLLRQGIEVVTYLDPDIRVYASLEPLAEQARAHGVVLTPHNTEPLPDDGERPRQIDILLAGVYNLGYVSLAASEEIHTLLRWWRERLLNDCRVDPLNGYFVDQRWFDLAPGLVRDHAVVREPQYNLAYWNLHSHRLEHGDAGYVVDGTPLAFFHFSGFDPREPKVLSRHQTRVPVDPGSALQRICREYSQEVAAAGHDETKRWPYTYNFLYSGIEFSDRLRKLHAAASEEGEVMGSPFAAAGCESFMKWLARSPPNAAPGLNRVLAELHGTRPDLQEAFPEVGRGEYRAFLNWSREVGVSEEPILASLGSGAAAGPLPEREIAEGAPRDVEAAPRLPPWGVNVVGYFRSELGTGEAARQVVSALDAAGVPVLPVHGRRIPLNRQGHVFTHLDHADARFPVNLICMNADMLGEFVAEAGPPFFGGRYSIGMWFWEVEKFPDVWISAFDHIDELWVATDHMARAIGAVSSVPVTKITLPVEMPPVLPASRAELELPEGFMFLFSFDHHSVFERKNPLAVIAAYTQAFGPADGAVLVIKSINADSAPEGHARLLAAAEGRPDIHVIDGYLSSDRKNQMVAACDCYVSLHRAEGFGLTMAEAMYLGKPVIATGYSGNLDFMTERNGFLVDTQMVPIGSDAAPYPADGQWAEPDLEHATRLFREVFERPHDAAERGRRAAADIRTTHSPPVAGAIMRHRLDVLQARHAERLQLIAPPASPTEPLEQRVGSGVHGTAPARNGRLRASFRRLLLRVLKPHTTYQHDVNAEVVRSLTALEAGVRDLDLTAAERQAQMLAAQRAASSNRALWEHVDGLTRATRALEREVGGYGHVTSTLQRIDWENRAIPYMEDPPFGDLDHPRVGRVQGYRRDRGREHVGVYRSFEDTFRGSEDLIRERQRVFLTLLGDRAPVLDFGCGRGEFLDLLAERAVPYFGVDSDAGMVRRCHEKGHENVIEGDGLDYLASFDDDALGAIFCAQVIEHLPYRALLRLLDLAREKLRDDGVFVAETVNPHCLSALKTFWVDPTHQHPIFPEVALHLCTSAGFSAAFIFHPNGTGDVAVDRFTQGEYALVAGGESLLSTSSEVGERAGDANGSLR